MKRLKAVLLALTALMLTSGCATTGIDELPELTLVNLEVSEVTMFETSMQVKLRISNPNPDPIVLNGASFKLKLNDKKVGSGATPERMEIPRLSSEIVDVEFHVSNASVLLRLKDVMNEKTVSYGLRGTLYRETSWGSGKIKVNREGVLDLENLPDFNDSQLDLDSLDSGLTSDG